MASAPASAFMILKAKFFLRSGYISAIMYGLYDVKIILYISVILSESLFVYAWYFQIGFVKHIFYQIYIIKCI